MTDHSYSVIKTTTVELPGETHQLIQLRNPWGATNWNGKWSNSSDVWTPELKKRLNFTQEDDDTFWMDFEDAKRYFSHMQICKVYDDFLYNYVECPDSTERFFRVTIDKPGLYTFSITQKDARFFKKDTGYKYSYSQIFLLK